MTDPHATINATATDTTSAPPGKPSLSADLAKHIAEQIERGVLAPGDRLPTEKVLVETHGVSRAVVREAIARLKSQGLVNSQRGSGAFVNEKVQSSAFRIGSISALDSQELEHILELMLSIEGTAARLAATRRTEDDLKRIRKGLIGMEYAILNDQLGDDEDYAFHLAIVQATHNPHLIALNDYLETSVRHVIRSARRNTAQLYVQRMVAVQAEHQLIFQAIEAGDAPAAAAAAEAHLRYAAERLRLYASDDVTD